MAEKILSVTRFILIIFICMQKLLRQFVAETIAETGKKEARIEPRDDELLTEPDFSADEVDAEEKIEVSVAGSVAGVTTPLGTGPTYPHRGAERKPTWAAASSGFGKAKPHKSKRNALDK